VYIHDVYTHKYCYFSGVIFFFFLSIFRFFPFEYVYWIVFFFLSSVSFFLFFLYIFVCFSCVILYSLLLCRYIFAALLFFFFRFASFFLFRLRAALYLLVLLLYSCCCYYNEFYIKSFMCRATERERDRDVYMCV